MIRLARAYIYVGLLVVALFGGGCATTKAFGAVAKACEPTAAQGMRIMDAANNPVQVEALAAIDALGFALCLVQRGVDEGIASLAPKSDAGALERSAESYSPILDNLRAWRAAHP